jgi:hypothetical protein
LGKVLEGLILRRLEEHVKSNGDLSCNRYGFRKGMSTIDAINKVVRTVRNANRGTSRKEGFTGLVSIDIRNAFNSIGWPGVINALKKYTYIPN